MQATPWSSEAPLRCLHTGQPPQAMSAREAFEAYGRCLKQHVFPDAVTALTELENKVMSVKERISKLREEEMEKLDAIQDRFRRISEIVLGAQAALQPMTAATEQSVEPQGEANEADSREKDGNERE